MYKVFYPEEIEEQNPADLVMLRANGLLNNENSYHLLLDNCEHFATYCKTGSHKCNQIFQCKVSMRTWFARFLVAFLHIAVAVFFSETIELLAPNTNKDWIGATVLISFECLCFLLTVWITYKYDTKSEAFKKGKSSQCSKAFRRVILRSALQSSVIVLCVVALSVFLGRAIADLRGQNWSVLKRVLIEIGLGVLGGILGNMLGFISFNFILFPCWRTKIPSDEEKQEINAPAEETRGAKSVDGNDQEEHESTPQLSSEL
ncbi:hypothetical protein HOLleu_42988 [Holothuria leucospilota]|uniref:LRAT domain-containing protein n=1 Tax=Holothuria leucospilota TaxID=206669 RepID=A0A9Q1B965_HOLLE|nr:hypothetical protein HOLleu_42988 [Holothuria leucospilota]